MQDNSYLPPEIPRKKAKNLDRSAYSSHKPCCCEEELKLRIVRLEEEVGRKDAMIEKLRLDRDVSLDPSTGSSQDYDGPPGYAMKMESTITHQNILIESLQESLKSESERYKKLSNEFFLNRDQATKEIDSLQHEIDDLQKLMALKNKECKEAQSGSNDKLEAIKKNLDEEYNEKINTLKDDLKKKYETDMERLNEKHKETIEEVMQSNKLKVTFLEKQVELLSNRVTELYERDVSHDAELQACRKIYEDKLNELKIALEGVTKQAQENNSLPEHLNSLNNQLAESLTNEVTLKAELNSCKKELDHIKHDFKLADHSLKESLKNEDRLSNKNNELEHNIIKLQEENCLLNDSLKKGSKNYSDLDTKYNDYIDDIQRREDELLHSYEHDILAVYDALKELTCELHSMSVDYTKKNKIATSQSSQESVVSFLSDSSKQTQEKNVNHVLHMIRKSYKYVSDMHDMLNNYIHLTNINEELNQENESLKKEMSDLKLASRKKSQIVDAQVDTLQDELRAWSNENVQLKNQLVELQMSSVTKIEYDNLLMEKNKIQNNLISLEKEINQLFEEIDDLKKINFEIKKRNDDLIENQKQLFASRRRVEQDGYPLHAQMNAATIEPKTSETCVRTPDSSDFNFDTSQGSKRHKLLSQVVSSTPFCQANNLDSEGGGENNFNRTNTESYYPVIKWMEKCNLMEQENVMLMHKIDGLNVRIKDLEYGAQIMQEEMRSFEIKKQSLESKVADYFSLKKRYNSLIESDREKALKIEELTRERDCLVETNKTLSNENIVLEKKYKEYIQNLNVEKYHEIHSDIITDLNAKIQEVVMLKEEVLSKQNLHKQLSYKLEAMTELKNVTSNKFVEVSNELHVCQIELENATKNNIEMATVIKLLEKACEIEKMRIEYLNQILDSRSRKLSSNLMEDMQQELLNMCKQFFEEKYKINKSLLDQELRSEETDNLDARHQMEILIKNISQLESEKKDLLNRLFEQQQIIRKYEENPGLDKESTSHLDKLENDLINELRSHREQYARIEEALRSTGSLHNELQKQKDESRNKMREICSFEKKIEEQKCALRSLKMKVAMLELEVQQKEELLKKSESQKMFTEEMLLSLQKKLVEGEAKYEIELKGKDWKLQEAKLMVSNAEVEKAMIKYECGDVRSSIQCSLEEERLKKLREFEQDYNNAIKQVRYYYMAQYKSDAAATQEQHMEQIAKLHKRIKEQALEIQLLQNGILNRNCSELSHKLSYQDVLKFNETLEMELNEIYSKLDEPTAQLFSVVKQKFRKLSEYQISSLLSSIERKYEKEFQASVETLKQLHNEEIELLKLRLEADKYNDLYQINQEVIKTEKDRVNSETQSEMKNASGSQKTVQKLNLILVSDYFYHVQNFMKNWNKLYRAEFYKVADNVTKQLDKYENEVIEMAMPLVQPDNVSQNIENLFENQEFLISESKRLIEYLEKEFKMITACMENTVLLCHEQAKCCVQFIKSELTESNDIISLKAEIEQLKIEKEDIQQKHKSAVELLLSDHEAELAKTRCLLSELKECGENGNNSALSRLKSELEEKHILEMENLRIYFENKCSEIKKQYSEEIESQQQSRRSSDTSCSESDLCLDVLYEPQSSSSNKHLKLQLTCSYEDFDRSYQSNSSVVKIMEQDHEDITSHSYAEGSQINMESTTHNMKNLNLKEINELNAAWEKKVELLKNELETKYLAKIEKLQNNLAVLQKSHEFDLCMSVQNVKAIRNDVHELDEIRQQIEAGEATKYGKLINKIEKELEEKYSSAEEKLKKEFKIKIDEEVEKRSSALKRQELENVWKAQIQMEEKHKEELRAMQDKLEQALIDDLGNVISDGTICKAEMESNFNLFKIKLQDDTSNKLHELEMEMQTKITSIQGKLDTNCVRLKNLQNKLDKITEEDLIHFFLRSPNLISKLKKELSLKTIDELNEEIQDNIQIKVDELQKLHNELEDKIKKSASDYIDLLTTKHKAEIEKIKFEHREEINNMADVYQKKIDNLQTKGSPKRFDQQTLDNIQQKVIADLVNRIKGGIELEETGGGDGVKNWSPEIAALEKLFASKYQRQLALKVQEHALEVATIKQHYNDKLKSQLQAYGIDEECIYSSGLPTGIKAVDEVIKERDCLKRMTGTLKCAVRQLAEYLITCEDELNKTVVRELLAVNQWTPKKGDNTVAIYELSDDEKNDSIVSLQLPQQVRRVHFAPNISEIIKRLDSDLSMYTQDNSSDVSTNFKAELGSCLDKLKHEAHALLGLSTFHKPLQLNMDEHASDIVEEKESLLRKLEESQQLLIKKEQELAKLHSEISETRDGFKQKVSECTCGSSELNRNASSFLHDKARERLNTQEFISPNIIKVIDNLCREGDRLLDEARRERDDLQQQVNAADKQLRSTRSFLEEQAAERETERDEFAKEVTTLHAQLKEKEKDWTTRQRFTSEVESLEQQVKETTTLLKQTQEKKDAIEEELKAAIDKVWLLRDIITELESQVSIKSEKEAALEKKLDELESELEQQNKAQLSMVEELEVLRNQNKDESYIEQIQQLHDNIKMQFNSSVVRQLKSQIRDMEKSVDQRIKELETLHVTNSSNSLSSPSEEISIREQLESLRSKTPEHCPSPVALPVEEITRLQEKLQRYARAEEVVIRQLRDQHMRFGKVNRRLEETQAQRDVLQQQSEKLMNQLAVANNKIDDLRRKADSAQMSVNRNIIEKVKELQEKLNETERFHKATCDKLTDTESQLQRAEAMLEEQRLEIKNLLKGDYEAVDSLRLELASVISEKNKLQALVDKYERELNTSEMPALMDVILADKNEDIEHLQQTVALLRSQAKTEQSDEDRSGHLNSKGHRVSFATDLSASCTSDDMRLRDAPKDHSLEPHLGNFSEELEDTSCVLKNLDEFFPEQCLPDVEISKDESTTDGFYAEKLMKELSVAKLELDENKSKVVELEKELQVLRLLDTDLNKTKKELEVTVTSVMEDKKYYEEQLTLMGERQKIKEEELLVLREVLAKKDEDIVRTTGDVRALQIILDNLQEKLKEAKLMAEREHECSMKEELNHLREENEFLKSKQQELSKIVENLNSVKNELVREKESNAQIKISVSELECEIQSLNSELNHLKGDNNTLTKKLEETEIRLQHYITISESLKQELLFNKEEFDRESKKISNNLQNTINKGSSDISNLCEEIRKLKFENNKLESVRCEIQEELNQVKVQLKEFRDLSKRKDNMPGLENEIANLNSLIKGLKDKGAKDTSNFMAEINKLQEDIELFKASEVDVKEKLKAELIEKQKLEGKVSVYDQMLAEEKKMRQHAEEKCGQLLSQKESRVGINDVQRDLSFSEVNVCEIVPDDQRIAGLEDLTVQVRKELNLSAQLDKTLLGTLRESSPEHLTTYEFISEDDCQSQTCELIKKSLTTKVTSLEQSILEEREALRKLKEKLAGEEMRLQMLDSKKIDLEGQLDRLHRVVSYQEERITQLSVQLNEDKNKALTFELNLIKEKTQFKQLQAILEDERQKARTAQREDTQLIETLRIKLESSLDMESKLKGLLLETRVKMQSLEAQINSARAIEQYNSDSENEHNKQLRKLLFEEKEKYVSLSVEAERLRRTCDDYEDALVRERKKLDIYKDKCQLAEQQRRVMENELDELRQNMKLEKQKCEIMEEKVRAVEEAEMRRSKSKTSMQAKHRQSLEKANSTVRELEKECKELREVLKAQQEHDDKWRDDIHIPLLHQLNEVNSNLESLVKERGELRSSVEKLKTENDGLKCRINYLHENIPERLQLPRSVDVLSFPEALPLESSTQRYAKRFRENDLDLYTKYLRAESFRKALVWQKRYLLVALHGYQDSEEYLMQRLGHKNAHSRNKSKFKCIALAVLAAVKIMHLVDIRKIKYQKSMPPRRALLRSEPLELPPMGPLIMPVPHSPPSRDTAASSLHRCQLQGDPSQLSPDTIMEYLRKFNEMQRRLGKTLEQANS